VPQLCSGWCRGTIPGVLDRPVTIRTDHIVWPSSSHRPSCPRLPRLLVEFVLEMLDMTTKRDATKKPYRHGMASVAIVTGDYRPLKVHPSAIESSSWGSLLRIETFDDYLHVEFKIRRNSCDTRQFSSRLGLHRPWHRVI